MDATPQFTGLTFKMEGKVALLGINRPERANALDAETWFSLKKAMEYFQETAEVRAIVLHGEGRHFCAGIDLQFLQSMQKEVADACPGRMRENLLSKIRAMQGAFNQVEHCPKPVIAAIHGACVGGGLDLAACCDFRYASEDAVFSVREVDMGIVADMGSLQRLPRLIGEGMAREMVYTGQNVSAKEALTIKLINKVFPDKNALLKTALDVADHIASKSPLTVRGCKQIMLHARDHSVAEGLEHVALWNAAMLLSEDLGKAITAAAKGEKPIFR